LKRLSHFFRNYFEVVFSEVVFGFGKIASAMGNQGKAVQNGSVGFYLLAFVVGVASILVCLFLV
jgi:NADH-quinone oxidoreductase subunit L